MDRASTRDCAINTIKTTQQSLWGQVPNISPSSGKASEKTVGGQGSQAIVCAYQWVSWVQGIKSRCWPRLGAWNPTDFEHPEHSLVPDGSQEI